MYDEYVQQQQLSNDQNTKYNQNHKGWKKEAYLMTVHWGNISNVYSVYNKNYYPCSFFFSPILSPPPPFTDDYLCSAREQRQFKNLMSSYNFDNNFATINGRAL